MKVSKLMLKRRSLGVTQEALAVEVGLYSETLRDLERDLVLVEDETYARIDQAIDHLAARQKDLVTA